MLLVVVVVIVCRSMSCASSFHCGVDGLKEQDVALPPNRRSEIMRKLVPVQVRTAVLSRQLKKALELKCVENISPDFESLNNELGECYELVSLIYADVLVSCADTDIFPCVKLKFESSFYCSLLFCTTITYCNCC